MKITKKQYVYRGNQKFFIKDLVQDISNKNINKWIKECEKLSSPGLIADTIKISKKMAAYTLLAIYEETIPKIKNNYKNSKYLLGVEKIQD